MSYILKIKALNSLPHYVKDNDKTYIYTMNPKEATVFLSKKAAETWVKENTSNEYLKTCFYKSAVSKFDKWVKEGYLCGEKKKIIKELSIKYNPEVHTADDVFNWRRDATLKECADSSVSYEIYKTWPGLHSVFECLWSFQKYYGQDYKTHYHTVSMCVKKTTDFNVFEKELNKVKEIITYRQEEEDQRPGLIVDIKPGLIVDIIDRFLCEGGNSAYFLIYDDGTYGIQERWGNSFQGSLKEVFDYWKRNRYYGGYKEDTDEEY